MSIIQDNGLILIIYKDKKYLKRITSDQSFHGKGGALNYMDIIGKEYGFRIGEYFIYEPTIEDIVMYAFKRETQIIYPKDSFYVAFKINVKSSSRVLEVGTGSGALTYILAHSVGPQGKIVTFELEERHYKNARKNIEKYGEWENVELHNEDVAGYHDGGFDAAFIDVREPWTCLDKVRSLMKESASVGMIVPTANQISELLKALENGFGHVEVMEIMHRKYKTVAERVRPQDRMIAHTGYLVFARKIREL
jgi:tRNA (adenine57-N1/adenine58-N1)-methyltransferase catalytic subunit